MGVALFGWPLVMVEAKEPQEENATADENRARKGRVENSASRLCLPGGFALASDFYGGHLDC